MVIWRGDPKMTKDEFKTKTKQKPTDACRVTDHRECYYQSYFAVLGPIRSFHCPYTFVSKNVMSDDMLEEMTSWIALCAFLVNYAYFKSSFGENNALKTTRKEKGAITRCLIGHTQITHSHFVKALKCPQCPSCNTSLPVKQPLKYDHLLATSDHIHLLQWLT